MAGVHQMMLQRVPAGSAFPTYWVSKTNFSGSGSFIDFYRGNDLTNLLSSSPSGITTRPSGPTTTSQFSDRRIGVLLANGNTAFSDWMQVTTNNGTSWASVSSPSVPENMQKISAEPTYGLNGMFAYKPASNTIVVFYTGRDDKGSGLNVYLYARSALTGVSQASNGFFASGGANTTATQILYAPNLDRYLVFANNNSNTVTNYRTFGSSLNDFGGSNISVDGKSFRAGVSAAGNVMVFWYIDASTRQLREYTSGDLTSSSYNNLGTVTGATLAGSFSNLVYLPVNQKYVMATKASANSVAFAYSAASTPQQFTQVTVNLTGLSATVSDVHGFTFFEETNGHIYLNIMATANDGFDGGRLTLTYVSTDGGASFSSAMGGSGAYRGALVIARNLQ